MPFDWSNYAVGGATRPDSFSGMDPNFSGALERFVQAQPGLSVSSGYRSIARQQQLWDASDKSGHMVARPGHSQHNFGRAADLRFGSDAARSWAHENAAAYGLNFPMSYEPWHVELAGARGMNRPPDAASLINPEQQDAAGSAPADAVAGGASNAFMQQALQGAQIEQPQQPDLFSGQYGMGNLGRDLVSGQNPLRRAVFSKIGALFGLPI